MRITYHDGHRKTRSSRSVLLVVLQFISIFPNSAPGMTTLGDKSVGYCYFWFIASKLRLRDVRERERKGREVASTEVTWWPGLREAMLLSPL